MNTSMTNTAVSGRPKKIGPLGRKIRQLLKQNRMSGRELGRRLGVSTGTVSNWCYDTWPRIEEMQRLAQEFSIPLNTLLADYENSVPGLSREVFSAVGRAVRSMLEEKGLDVSKISWDRYEHLVYLAYGKYIRDELQGATGEEALESLAGYMREIIPLLAQASH